jgi:ERCC4-type nuclease
MAKHQKVGGISKPLHVLVDSREKNPWTFPRNTRITKKKLETGDYSLYGWEEQVVIERKGWPDYYNCCIGQSNTQMRFMEQMERLASMPFACIMVEGMLSRCYQGFARGTREDMSRLIYVTASITSEYSVPI